MDHLAKGKPVTEQHAAKDINREMTKLAKALNEASTRLAAIGKAVAVISERFTGLIAPCRRCDNTRNPDNVDPTLCAKCEAKIRDRTYTAMAVVLAALCVLMIHLNGAT